MTSSVSGQSTMPLIGAYSTAKAALGAMARAIAVEYGASGITANAIAPGFVRTEFTAGLQQREGFEDFLRQEVPQARWATPEDIAHIEAAYVGMKQAVEEGGDYVTHDLRFHEGLLQASHNRMLVQMSKALGALLRTSFEISTSRPDGPASSLPLHRTVLDGVIARNPVKAERAALVLIDSARDDIEQVLGSRRKLPSVSAPAQRLKGRSTAPLKEPLP
jgi:hypothetical protein